MKHGDEEFRNAEKALASNVIAVSLGSWISGQITLYRSGICSSVWSKQLSILKQLEIDNEDQWKRLLICYQNFLVLVFTEVEAITYLRS